MSLSARVAVIATVLLVAPATPVGAADPTTQPPQITVLKRSAQDSPGYVFVAPKATAASAGPQGPEIVDDFGRPVWFDALPSGEQVWDFRVQRYRDKPVLTWWQGGTHGGVGHGEGVDYIADSSYHVITTVHAGNGYMADGHEFRLTPQGTALIEIYHAVPYDLSGVGGPVNGQVLDCIIQEIDVATGRVLFEWHSLDHVGLDESESQAPASGYASPYDYFHINAVNLDSDGNLLVSARNTWTIYKIDRRTGRIIWRLGGKRSDFALGPDVQFAWQHNALPAGNDTIRIFDNESAPPEKLRSRVIWIHLDLKHKQATLARSITHPDGLSANSQGNAEALDAGHTFVGWGATGRVSEFDADGNLLFDASVPNGYDTYRGYRFPWTGMPDTPPTTTATRNPDGTIAVDAVWNGATDVARWRILGGVDGKALAPIASVDWNGLDTSATVRNDDANYIAVQAVSAAGKTIGASDTVAVS